MKSVEKISIILPSYNYDSFISETIESVLKQSHKDWELIIVDDGSKDNSVRVIEKYIKKCDKIQLFFHPNKENKGLVETYKLGFKHCLGDICQFGITFILFHVLLLKKNY
jgi:glycosyltransferase involved in cell wall biosynthesis